MSRPHDQRFLSLDELHEHTRKRYEGSWQSRANTKTIEVYAPDGAMHDLRVGIAGHEAGSDVQRVRDVSPNHWSFGQLASLAKAPAGFLRELPSPLVSDTLNWRMRFAREVEEIKYFGSEDQLWAATGPDYGRIPDHEIVQALQAIAGSGRGESRWKIPGVLDWRTSIYNPEAPVTKDSTTLYASDRDVFCFLVDDRNPIEVGKLANGEPDYMFRGFYIQNSEVGSKSLKLAAFYLRAVCMNRNLWGVEDFEELKINHTRLAPDRWLKQAQPALRSFAEGSSAKLIEGVTKAKEAMVAKDDESAMEFLQARSFSRSVAKRMMERAETDEGHKPRSAWDMAQAITAYARTVPNTDDRLSVEGEARKILDKVA
jgi:hypothetical protein